MKIIINFVVALLVTIQVSAQTVVLQHKFITIQYDTGKRGALNVRYILKADSINKLATHRTVFHYEEKLPRRYQADMQAYVGSDYDRGHLAPDRDFTYNIDAEYEVMSMANIVPQNKNLNRGLWKKIETYVRDLSFRFDSLEVVTGVLYKSNNTLYGVPIPTHFYKIVNTYKYKLVFLCKNEECIACDIDDFLIEEKELYKMSRN